MIILYPLVQIPELCGAGGILKAMDILPLIFAFQLMAIRSDEPSSFEGLLSVYGFVLLKCTKIPFGANHVLTVHVFHFVPISRVTFNPKGAL